MAGGDGEGRQAPEDSQACFKAGRLRRMQRLATALLGLMLAILVLSVAFQSRYSWLQWMRAFAEAGVVGALADWYAVTALFRHPLGLPIPHTAIIPRNKDRIGESLGEFVQQNFLTPENIAARLRQHDAAEALGRWLAVRRNSLAVASTLADFVPVMLDGLKDEEIRQFLDRTLTPQLLSLNVSRISGEMLAMLTESGRHQVLFDRGLQALERFLVARRDLIEAKFSEASRYTPRGLDGYVVRKFLQGIVTLLHEVAANPRHELRQQFEQAVQGLIQNLKYSEVHRRKGQALLLELLEQSRAEGLYESIWDSVRRRVLTDLESESSLILEHVGGALVALGESLIEAPAVRQKLNGWWLDFARKSVVRFRHQVSGLVTDVVKSWDSHEVSRRVEREIGGDLQFVRINGTLVGGLAGLLLHAGIYLARS